MRTLLLAMVLVVGQSAAVLGQDFEWKDLLIASLKLRPGLDYEANADSYMQVFRPDVWNRFRNDEFEMANKRRETIELMKKAIESYPIEKEFVIRTSTRMGSYDFESQKFPLDGWSESCYFHASNYPHGSFPSSIRVFMDNTNILKELPMEESRAKDFIRGRINRYGDSDRQIYLKLNLRITGLKSDSESLTSEITKFSIYADSRHTNLLYSFDQEKENNAAKKATVQAAELANKGNAAESAK